MVKISEGSGTYQLEVKFLDLVMTNNCEGICPTYIW